MRKLLLAVAVLLPVAVAASPFRGGGTAIPTQSLTQGQSWCDANAARPVFGAVLCAAASEGVRVYIRGLPFET